MSLQTKQFFGAIGTVASSAFWGDESGQDLIEYALLGGVIGLGAVASMRVVANDLKAVFTAIPAKAEQAMFG